MTRQLLHTVFDAMPIPTFIVDEDVKILHFNTAASRLLGPDPSTVLHQRTGDVLQCIHAEARGCGCSEQCKNCVIRNSVNLAMAGQSTQRQMHRLEIRTQEKSTMIDLMISVSHLPDPKARLALLVLEDVSELLALRGLLPVCAQCKKVRDDQQYWHSMESYLHTHMNLKLSHGLCPTCFDDQMKAVKESHAKRLADAENAHPELALKD